MSSSPTSVQPFSQSPTFPAALPGSNNDMAAAVAMPHLFRDSQALPASVSPAQSGFSHQDALELAGAGTLDFDTTYPQNPHSFFMAGQQGPAETSAEVQSYASSQSPSVHAGTTSPHAKSEPIESPIFCGSSIDALILPSADGFVVAPSSADMGQNFMNVSWATFYSFACDPKNTANLPLDHPLHRLARALQETPTRTYEPVTTMQTRLQHQGDSFPSAHQAGAYTWTSQPATIAPAMTRRFSEQQTVPRHYQNQSPISVRAPASAYSVQNGTGQRVKMNPCDDHFVFSQHDGKLYRLATKEGERALQEPDYTLITFAAGTVREARERDGQRAIPAWTSAWPSSNEWLKGQVCGPSCMYTRGFAGKRPVLIREHFRKCQHLTENHPLKVLCRLELEAHARSSWTDRGVKRKRGDLSVSTSLNSSAYNDPAWLATQTSGTAPQTAQALPDSYRDYHVTQFTPAPASAHPEGQNIAFNQNTANTMLFDKSYAFGTEDHFGFLDGRK